MRSFVDFDYTPKEDDIVCLFKITPAKGKTLEEAANHVAAESSIGTWTEVKTMNEEIWENLRPRIIKIDKKTKHVMISYPIELFEMGNIPQLLSSIAGNIFGMKVIDALRLEDIHIPKKYMRYFKGPKYGIKGVRKIFNIWDRPLLGTIVKPKVGLNQKDHAKVAYEAWVGGVDIVKDDENLTSQSFNKFEKRVKETLKMKEKAEKETGQRKGYMANITAPYKEMIRRAKLLEDYGNEYLMVDVVTVGFSALQELREEDFMLIMHAHRAMHAAITRNKNHGISMLTLAKLYRLIGVDQLHIGTIVGKMEGGKREVQEIYEEIEESVCKGDGTHWLSEEWFGIKPVFAVSSGGVYPRLVPKIISYLGKDVIIQAGGGIHGHPKGTRAGAKAMLQAVEATMQNISLEEYAKKHKELKEALKHWK